MKTTFRYEVAIEPHPNWEAPDFTGTLPVGRFMCRGDAELFARWRCSSLIIARVIDTRKGKSRQGLSVWRGGATPRSDAP